MLYLQKLRKNIGTFKTLLLVLVGVVVFFVLSYKVGNYFHNYQKQIIEQQKNRLENLYALEASLEQRINILEVELEVERMANQELQASFKELDAQYFDLKKELAFYQKVMAPEKQAEGLAIDGIEITSTASKDHYRFQVILVQTNKLKRYAKGYIELKLEGSQLEKPLDLDIASLAEIDRKALSFNLQYFQVISGEFTLPEGYRPERIVVNAVLPKGKWQKYAKITEYYNWQQALAE